MYNFRPCSSCCMLAMIPCSSQCIHCIMHFCIFIHFTFIVHINLLADFFIPIAFTEIAISLFPIVMVFCEWCIFLMLGLAMWLALANGIGLKPQEVSCVSTHIYFTLRNRYEQKWKEHDSSCEPNVQPGAEPHQPSHKY